MALGHRVSQVNGVILIKEKKPKPTVCYILVCVYACVETVVCAQVIVDILAACI